MLAQILYAAFCWHIVGVVSYYAFMMYLHKGMQKIESDINSMVDVAGTYLCIILTPIVLPMFIFGYLACPEGILFVLSEARDKLQMEHKARDDRKNALLILQREYLAEAKTDLERYKEKQRQSNQRKLEIRGMLIDPIYSDEETQQSLKKSLASYEDCEHSYEEMASSAAARIAQIEAFV